MLKMPREESKQERTKLPAIRAIDRLIALVKASVSSICGLSTLSFREPSALKAATAETAAAAAEAAEPVPTPPPVPMPVPSPIPRPRPRARPPPTPTPTPTPMEAFFKA